jgi:hypothetical protein
VRHDIPDIGDIARRPRLGQVGKQRGEGEVQLLVRCEIRHLRVPSQIKAGCPVIVVWRSTAVPHAKASWPAAPEVTAVADNEHQS